MSPPLVFLDLETSGLDPAVHEAIEFGLVFEDGSDAAFSVAFDVERASPKALEVNGYGEREFAPALPWRTAAITLHGALKGAVVVGNAVHFDLAFTSAFIRRHSSLDPQPWDHRAVDLKSLAAGRIGIDPRKLTSGAIGRHFGEPLPEDAHSALADAHWNRRLYNAMGLYRG
jgi:DNA polymerase III alpha subunit (gram-positive type)